MPDQLAPRAAQLTPSAAKPVAVRTADGVLLRGLALCPRPGAAAPDLAVVVGHGFTLDVHRPALRRLLHRLAGHAGVVALDFRGHGRSAGRSTVGDAEVADLDAGLAFARAQGYRRVAMLGFSMGAAVALRQAALAPAPRRPDAVVAVSSPARWWARETPALRRVHWLIEQPHGRLAARALGVRLDRPWEVVPASPVEVVERIGPGTPLLLVHGDADRYFPVTHAHALHRASGGHAELWLERGMGHAETATGPDRVDRLVGWLDAHTGGA